MVSEVLSWLLFKQAIKLMSKYYRNIKYRNTLKDKPQDPVFQSKALLQSFS